MKPKTKTYYLVCTLVSLFAASRSTAAEKARDVVVPAPETRAGRAWTTSQPMPIGEKEVVTFLGVETAPVSPSLGSQLGLAKDFALVVVNIVPDSSAASELKQHDVLVKLDDQVLVDSQQLSVLVRNHKEGDEVTFTYLRAGKQATARIKLGKHEVPKGAFRTGGTFGSTDGFNMLFEKSDRPPGSREETDRVLGMLQGGVREVRPTRGSPAQTLSRESRGGAPGFRAININPADSNLVYSDEQGSLELTIKEGMKTLVAKNPKGEQIFSGPVNKPEERHALPPDLRDRLDKIEGMQEFTFRTEEGFVPTTRTIRAFPQGIAFPLPESGAREIHEFRGASAAF